MSGSPEPGGSDRSAGAGPGDEPGLSADGPGPSADGPGVPRSRPGRGALWTGVLVALMVGTGLLAMLSVTPQRDTDRPSRPAGSDLVVAGGAPEAWDPAAIMDGTSAQVLAQVFEGLTAFDADSQVRPALAQDWSMSDEGRRIEFRMRPGMTFSDGTPITAQDVRRSWLRILDPAAPGPLAALLDDVSGAADHRRGTGSSEDVAIRAEGDRLTVGFDRPAAYFPAVAATQTLAVVPEGIERGRSGAWPEGLPVSGAYLPVEQTAEHIRLGANERYWAGRAPLGSVTLLVDAGGYSLVELFEDGAVDWATISRWDVPWIRYERELGPQLRRWDTLAVDFVGFDTRRPPFSDARLRRAVAMAVDWRRISALAQPDATVATSLIPVGIAGRGEEDFLPPYDPEAARAELAAAGFPGGVGLPPIVFATYGVGEPEAVALELERELRLRVEVEERPFEQFSALLDGDTPDMWTLSWSADYPHPHDFLGLLLGSESSANAGGWSGPDFDALIEAAASTSEPIEQERLYREAQAIVRQQAPVIPLRYAVSWALSREGLRGAAPSGMGILRLAGLDWKR